MDKTDRLRDYGLAFLLYEHGLGVCGYELIRELFIFIKLILNSYLLLKINIIYSPRNKPGTLTPGKQLKDGDKGSIISIS